MKIGAQMMSSALCAVFLVPGAAWAQAGAAPGGQAGSPMPGDPAPATTGTIAAQSAENAGPSDGLEEIVVTAQKHSENLQKVPIAVAVATAGQLQASGISDVASLKILTPGVEVQSSHGYALPIIRGVGSKGIGAGIETPIAIYVDGVYYAAANANLLTFNNISQVEILKGPQGTLFGRNATGGLIQIFTKDPSHELGGEFNLSYGNYQTLKGDAYITGGLAENLAVDLALTGVTMGKGFGTNLFNGDDVYKINHDLALRSKWYFTAGNSTEVRLIIDYSDAKHNMNTQRVPIGETIPAPYGPVYGGNPWDTATDPTTVVKTHGGGASLRVDQDFGGVQLASITAYRKFIYSDLFDFDYTPTNGRVFEVHQKDWQFSQELQLLSPKGGAISWVLGGYYFKASADYPLVQLKSNGPAATTPAGNPTIQSDTLSRQLTDSIAAFGQATVEVLDGLHATGGLRYTNEKRTLADATSFNTRADGSVVVTVPLNTRSTRFKKLTWRLALDYAFTPDILGYVSYNRGFKSGGFSPSALTIAPFRPEVLDAYETGFKTTWLDNRLRFNAAAYYYDYKDVQVQRSVVGATGIYNGAAEIYGADAELQAQITRQFNVNLGYQYTHGKYPSFPGAIIATPRAAGGYGIAVGDASGNRTILSPRSTLSASANYKVPLSNGDLNFNVSAYYNSGYFHEPDNAISQPEYMLVNTSIRWESKSGLSVSMWGNNLTNRAVANNDSVATFGATGIRRASYAPPRTYGVRIGVKF